MALFTVASPTLSHQEAMAGLDSFSEPRYLVCAQSFCVMICLILFGCFLSEMTFLGFGRAQHSPKLVGSLGECCVSVLPTGPWQREVSSGKVLWSWPGAALPCPSEGLVSFLTKSGGPLAASPPAPPCSLRMDHQSRSLLAINPASPPTRYNCLS